jgi:hypothetical protein
MSKPKAKKKTIELPDVMASELVRILTQLTKTANLSQVLLLA